MIESFSEATEARAAFKLPKRLVEDLDRCEKTRQLAAQRRRGLY